MSEKLKPCPFCGSQMEVETIGRSWWRIKPVDGHDDLCLFGEQHEWDRSQSVTKQEHIDDWNHQVAVNYLNELNDKNQEAIEQLKENQLIAIQALKDIANNATLDKLDMAELAFDALLKMNKGDSDEQDS